MKSKFAVGVAGIVMISSAALFGNSSANGAPVNAVVTPTAAELALIQHADMNNDHRLNSLDLLLFNRTMNKWFGYIY